MNAKQTAPLLVTLAPLTTAIAPAVPALLIGGAALLLLNWLFSDDDKQKQPEIPRKVAKTPVFRQIPAEIPAKPAVIPRPALPRVIVLPPGCPTVPKIAAPVLAPAAVIVPKIATQALPPSPVKKKFVTREDLAKVFANGTRKLNRTAAVMELKKLGFGKTAAYAALSPHGRFATWLHCAPDGIISWTDAQKIQS